MTTTTERQTACQRREERDYRAEYRRRIQRGRANGLSRRQAAGHPRRNQLSADQISGISWCVYLAARRVTSVTPEELPDAVHAAFRHLTGEFNLWAEL